MKVKKGDNVVVIAGRDKGKTGKVMRVFRDTGKVVVEKINMRTKFRKKTHQGPGQLVKFEARLDASNVMLVDASTKKRTRIGSKTLANGKKVRIAKKSNEEVK